MSWTDTLAGWRLRAFAGRICRGGGHPHFALGADPSKATYFERYMARTGTGGVESGIVEYDSSRLRAGFEDVWAGDDGGLCEARETAGLAGMLRSRSAVKEDVSPLIYEMF